MHLEGETAMKARTRAETRGEYELRGEKRVTARQNGWRERDVPKASERMRMPLTRVRRGTCLFSRDTHVAKRVRKFRRRAVKERALFTCLLIVFLICLFGMMNIKHMHTRILYKYP